MSHLYDFKKLEEDLKGATITNMGSSIMVMFRSRDRLSHELKKAFSHSMVDIPIHFVFQPNVYEYVVFDLQSDHEVKRVEKPIERSHRLKKQRTTLGIHTRHSV